MTLAGTLAPSTINDPAGGSLPKNRARVGLDFYGGYSLSWLARSMFYKVERYYFLIFIVCWRLFTQGRRDYSAQKLE